MSGEGQVEGRSRLRQWLFLFLSSRNTKDGRNRFKILNEILKSETS